MLRPGNARLIFLRELRDQLRDRRTLFTVLVLPMLIYPLMGMSFLQISQFLRETPTVVWLIGPEQAASSITPSLCDRGLVNEAFLPTDERKLLVIDRSADVPPEVQAWIEIQAQVEQKSPLATPDKLQQASQTLEQAMKKRGVDLVALFAPIPAPSDSASLATDAEISSTVAPNSAPVVLVGPLARDGTRVALNRFQKVIDRWQETIVQERLIRRQVDPRITKPLLVSNHDLSAKSKRQAMIWSKILPFVMLLWALTGAFYPAVDTCAGEKERGTLETMLCGPAARSEIVAGKLGMVILFSAATSALNLASMMLSGVLIIGAMPDGGAGLAIGPPPLSALLWLGLAMIPASALFGSLSLAIAVFARSTKEGQYYLMPLLLTSLPLMMIALLPATQLELGTSLIPLTGLMLLLRELIEGDLAVAATFAAPVMAVTLCGVYLSARWAVSQFNNESVIFRESEQVGLSLWFRGLVRDRGALPTASEALLCGLIILIVRFFGGLAMPIPRDWNSFAMLTTITLVAFIAAPAAIMAVITTRHPAKALMLRPVGILPLITAPLLAIALHPLLSWLGSQVLRLYPPTPEFLALQETLQGLFDQAPYLAAILAVISLTPAICEELAFRGYILSGLSRLGSKWASIPLSAVFFGVAHGLLQQSIVATFTGLVLGYVAFQSRSLFPAILYHLTHNALSVLVSHWSEHPESRPPFSDRVLDFTAIADGSPITYDPLAAIAMSLIGIGMLVAMARWNPTHSLESDPRS